MGPPNCWAVAVLDHHGVSYWKQITKTCQFRWQILCQFWWRSTCSQQRQHSKSQWYVVVETRHSNRVTSFGSDVWCFLRKRQRFGSLFLPTQHRNCFANWTPRSSRYTSNGVSVRSQKDERARNKGVGSHSMIFGEKISQHLEKTASLLVYLSLRYLCMNRLFQKMYALIEDIPVQTTTGQLVVF